MYLVQSIVISDFTIILSLTRIYLLPFPATTTFLPCGLAMGYIFVTLPNSDGVLQYGPLFVGLLFAFICAAGLFATKFIYDHVVFWHFDVLLVAAFFNLLGGCFFFIHEFGESCNSNEHYYSLNFI